jgi:hypothetical protein
MEILHSRRIAKTALSAAQANALDAILDAVDKLVTRADPPAMVSWRADQIRIALHRLRQNQLKQAVACARRAQSEAVT